jgi:NAD+ kinase
MKYIALYGKAINNYNVLPIQRLVSKLEGLGIHISIHRLLFELAGERINFKNEYVLFNEIKDLSQRPDFFISVGGDGTMLNSVVITRDSGIPIIGINTGRLGFLSGISIDDIESALDRIISGDYEIEERILIRLNSSSDVFGSNNFALNEIAIHRSESSAMMTIHAYLNGKFMNSYWADGLIISTPTGSTAYSLSCGGPIVMPDSGNFIVTPISPHNLNVRPVIISDKDTISLKVVGRNRNFMVSLDSRSASFQHDQEISVLKEKFTVKLIRMPGNDFLETLRAKLMWGLDTRN